VYTSRDFRTGAGWGVHGADGTPKAAHWYLRRAFAPLTVVAVDDGLNGLDLHLLNDGPAEFKGTVALALYRNGELEVGRAESEVALAPHGGGRLHADSLFDGFRDLTYAYRFGPPNHDLVHVRLIDAAGTAVADTFAFPTGLPAAVEPDIGLGGELSMREGRWTLRVQSRRFATAVRVEVRGYRPLDNYFHLAPGVSRVVPLVSVKTDRPPSVQLSALNSATTARVTTESSTPDWSE
jgi:beta-mannosidase